MSETMSAFSFTRGACSQQDRDKLRRSPETQISLIEGSYAVAKALVPPACGPASRGCCLDEATSVQVAKAEAVADVAVAKAIIPASSSDAGSISRAVRSAWLPSLSEARCDS